MPPTKSIAENLVFAYCKAWNNLDTSYIEDHLNDNFSYSSQSVLATMESKAEYITYLKGKYAAIKESGNSIKAEIGYYGDSPCLVMVQTIATAQPAYFFKVVQLPDGTTKKESVLETERTGIVLVEIAANKIKSAIMCSVAPTIKDVRRTGIYPQ